MCQERLETTSELDRKTTKKGRTSDWNRTDNNRNTFFEWREREHANQTIGPATLKQEESQTEVALIRRADFRPAPGVLSLVFYFAVHLGFPPYYYPHPLLCKLDCT